MKLTAKEQFVMDRLCDGERFKALASVLGYTRTNVGVIARRARIKLGAKTTAQACVIHDRKNRIAST